MKKLKDNILCWCENPEQGAINQAINISNHPWLVGNVCLMPDTHEGYGMPIGGVAALDNAICPNMVGVDIGCGMLAVKTNLTTEQVNVNLLKQVMGKIRERVPVGFNHHTTQQLSPVFADESWNHTTVCLREFESARYQIGTLGGGNHFIEIQRDEGDNVWFMIHSGSRNLGKKVADFYNHKAKEMCEFWKQNEIVNNDLAILPIGTNEARDYIVEMEICLNFAYENRMLMAQRIMDSFADVFPDFNNLNMINIHHNYATLEHHFGRNVWVHRKGATLAREGTIGVIPGSQGTCSYIVEGSGNEASLQSCSHGAGRKMSRMKAKQELTVEGEAKRMDDLGIVHSIRNVNDLDEAPSAYKDIDVVMDEQKDLVKILFKLSPMGVIKG